jgi:Outer membrane protein beta-barrel domain
MKKIIVLSLFVSLFITSKAQTTFGFKGGVNLASVKVVVPEAGMSVSTSNNTSFFLGGYMNHLLSENLSIQPELLYQGMGFKFSGETLNSNYISIPVVLKYAITSFINIEAGPQIGFLMSAKAMGEDVKDAFKSTDFQLVFGGGINFTNKIQANVRYGIGMSNISENYHSTFGNGTSTKSSALSIGLSYSL